MDCLGNYALPDGRIDKFFIRGREGNHQKSGLTLKSPATSLQKLINDKIIQILISTLFARD